jgi:hypothetical protein
MSAVMAVATAALALMTAVRTFGSMIEAKSPTSV